MEKAKEIVLQFNQQAKNIRRWFMFLPFVMIGVELIGLFSYYDTNIFKQIILNISIVVGSQVFLILASYLFLIYKRIRTFQISGYEIIYRRRNMIKPGISHGIRFLLKSFSIIFIGLLLVNINLLLVLKELFFCHQMTFNPLIPFSGLILVTNIAVLLSILGFVLLPYLISRRVAQPEFKYIYWLYFIKSRILEGNFTAIFGIPLVVICSIIVVFSSFTNEATLYSLCNENIAITSSNTGVIEPPILFSSSNFSVFLSAIGIWLSVLTIVISDFAKNFLRINTCFINYSDIILRRQIFNTSARKFIFIGFGYISKKPLGYCLSQLLKQTKLSGQDNLTPKSKKQEISNLFNIIIDKQLKLRLIPVNILVIEKNDRVFEELGTEKDANIQHGFLSCLDIPVSYDFTRKPHYEPILALAGINSDATSFHPLNAIAFQEAFFIVNTSLVANIGYHLVKNIKKSTRQQIEENESSNIGGNVKLSVRKPILITTEPDAASYSFLENQHDMAIFPIYPDQTVGYALGCRLFLALTKNANSIEDLLNNSFIHIIGHGKRYFHMVIQLINILSSILPSPQLQRFINERIVVITYDDDFSSVFRNCHAGERANIGISRSEYRLMKWDIFHKIDESFHINAIPLQQKRSLLLPVIGMETRKNYIKLGMNDFPPAHYYFICKGPEDVPNLKVIQNLKLTISNLGIDNFNLITDVNTDEIEDFNIINSNGLEDIERLAQEEGYPHLQRSHLIKKDFNVSAQISSIMDSFDLLQLIVNPDIKNKEKADKIHEILKTTGELTICGKDSPLLLISILCKLSGLSNIRKIDHITHVPTFYYSYSYKVTDPIPEINNSFVFRGDCYLEKIHDDSFKPKMEICGFSLNGTETFEKEFCTTIHRIFRDNLTKPTCLYSHRCPVSFERKQPILSANDRCRVNSTKKKMIKNDTLSFASVKIWGMNEDIPGSMAIALADFMMLGGDLKFSAEQSFADVLNISFSSSYSCTNADHVLMKFHTVKKDINDNLSRKQRASLQAKKNIIALKIKLNKETTPNDDWSDYFNKLIKYINESGISTYDCRVFPSELHIFNIDLYTEIEKRRFFDDL